MDRTRKTRIAVYVLVALVGAWGLWTTNQNSRQLDAQVAANHAAIIAMRQAQADIRELNCRIGGFLVGTPVVRQPGTPEEVFIEQVGKAEAFLIALRRFDCAHLGGVSGVEIRHQLQALRAAAPSARGGGHLQSGSTPGQQPAPPSGGGHHDNHPPPDNGNPPPHKPPHDVSVCVRQPLLPRCVNADLP